MLLWSTVACEQAHVGAQARAAQPRDEKVTFLASLHQTPSRRIALPFGARACDSKVSLLAG